MKEINRMNYTYDELIAALMTISIVSKHMAKKVAILSKEVKLMEGGLLAEQKEKDAYAEEQIKKAELCLFLKSLKNFQ